MILLTMHHAVFLVNPNKPNLPSTDELAVIFRKCLNSLLEEKNIVQLFIYLAIPAGSSSGRDFADDKLK